MQRVSVLRCLVAKWCIIRFRKPVVKTSLGICGSIEGSIPAGLRAFLANATCGVHLLLHGNVHGGGAGEWRHLR